jgi:hypothetical protein
MVESFLVLSLRALQQHVHGENVSISLLVAFMGAKLGDAGPKMGLDSGLIIFLYVANILDRGYCTI